MADIAPPRTERDVPGTNILHPPFIPEYDLIRRIGRGSYGEVWLAKSAHGDFRAVKVIYRRNFDNDRPYERELSGIQRFEPVSRSHPSQVNILQIGRNESEAFFYYVMELADDANTPPPKVDSPRPPINPASYDPKTLRSELARQSRLPFDECLRISLALTTALEHLHRHDLIHRDIKPANVIFVNGMPKLADIGLVTDVGASISFVGTEGFLPPEGPGTARADIYSLGKVLYEISTGRDRLDFPELPTFLDESDPGHGGLLELNLVFLKACQNDPRRRYPSAKAMAADLALLQSGKSLKRSRATERNLTRLRRLALVSAVIAGGALLTQQFLHRQQVERLRESKASEEESQRRIERYFRDKSDELVQLLGGNADRAAAAGDSSMALLWAANALQQEATNSSKLPSHLERVTRLAKNCPRMIAFCADQRPVQQMVFSQDGRRIATATDDHQVHLWDAEIAVPLFPPLPHPGAIRSIAFSSDARRLLTACADGNVRRWNLITGESAGPPLAHGTALTAAFFVHGGRQVVSLGKERNALIWVAGTGRPRFTLTHDAPISRYDISPDGRLLATVTSQRTLHVWDTAVGELWADPLRLNQSVDFLAFSPGGDRLLVVLGNIARVFEVKPLQPTGCIVTHTEPILTAQFTPDGNGILTASQDQTLQVSDARTGERLVTIRSRDPIGTATISPDGNWIAVGSGTKISFWQAGSGLAAVEPPWMLHRPVQTVAFSGGCDQLLVGTDDGTVQVLARASYAGLDRLTPENWARFAELIAGRRAESGEAVPLTSSNRMEIFQTMRSRVRSLFPPRDRLAWHQEQAEENEKSRNWFAAQFHWNQVALLNPLAPGARQRREELSRQLQTPKPMAHVGAESDSRFPLRAPAAREALIDLTPHYNASLTESRFPGRAVASGNDLAALPWGVQELNGIEFDIRGLIQVSGSALETLHGGFPKQVDGIRIQRRCARLHFLHGAAWSASFRTIIGSYQIHYVDGQTREIRLSFGENIQDWWFAPGQTRLTTSAAVAWEGSNAATRDVGMALRLYHMVWQNPLPKVEIATIDFVSAMERPAPFLVAITAE